MVTVAQLHDWKPEALSAAADDLRRQATLLDELAQRLGSVTSTRLHDAWDGYAATEARTRVVQKQAQLAAFAGQVAAGGTALNAAATAIAEAQTMLSRAARVATDGGLRLDENGTATAPPADGTLARLAPDDLADIRALQLDDVRQATLYAQAALAAAEEADRDAARTLGELPTLTSLSSGVGLAIGPLLVGGPLRALLLAGLLQGITLRDLPPPGASPKQAATWWAGLSPEQQRLQIRANPDAIGMMDGLPARARHAANVLVLARERGAANSEVGRLQTELARARAEAAAHPPRYGGRGFPTAAQVQLAVLQGRLDEAIRHRDMLASVQSQLDADPGGRTLFLLDTRGTGRAAIALGPVDTARHVAIVVPGLDQDVREEMGRIVYNADRLKTAAEDRLTHLPDGGSVATVAWIGYDTPNMAQVSAPHHAERGSVYLRGTVNGLDAAREAARIATSGDARPDPVHLTVVGHSYGSLTTGLAVREPTQVDEVAFIGSPGVGADNVSQLHVQPGHVFVGEARGDAVADFQRFGTDPNDPDFGAREFRTDEFRNTYTGEVRLPSHGHSEYFDERTTSVYNLAYIMLGRDDLVSEGNMDGFGDGAMDSLLGKDIR